MLKFLRRRWFLIGLVILIPGGFWLGHVLGKPWIDEASDQFAAAVARWDVIAVLFLMSWTLNTTRLVAAVRSPGPVLWATLVNAGLIPLGALALQPIQFMEDFAVGLMVAGSVPCTMAAASVWTRKSAGNDAISMLVTIITNGACFLVIPFWLSLGIGDSVQLDVGDLMMRLVTTALLPILVGQVCRLPAPLRHFADISKHALGTAAQACILLIVFWASVQGGPQLQSGFTGPVSGETIGVAVVWGSCIALHLSGFAVAILGARLLRFTRADSVAVGYAGSQKTLPIGLYLVTDVLAGRGIPFAVFPMLMFHVSQLFIDTLFIERLASWVERSEVPSAAEAET